MTFPSILPLSHKHSLSCLLYNIFNVLSFALFVTCTYWHSHKHTPEPWHIWGGTFCQSYIRAGCTAGSVGLWQQVRAWRPEFPLQTPHVLTYKSPGCCQNCGFVDYAHGWSTYELKGFQVWVWWVMSWFFSYRPFYIQLNWMINSHFFLLV